MRQTFLILGLAVSFVIAPLDAFAAADTPQGALSGASAAGCAQIDSNWKEYNRQIRGANTKVSDVVLNACAALGGEGQCQFTSGYRSLSRNVAAGGAKNSQHIQANAIDLRVPSGKEAEFMTFAICGLRRINGCQGGLGLYSNKVIHVDVRSGTTNAWSTGYSRNNITPANIPSAEARNILRAFDADKCTGGIQEDYSEKDIYGPPVQYTPPTGFPQALQPAYPTTGYTSLTPQLVTSNLMRPVQYATTGGRGVLSGSYVLDGLGDTSPQNTGFLTRSDNTEERSVVSGEDQQSGLVAGDDTGDDSRVRCEGSGLFGINLFGTCKETEAAAVAEESQVADEPNEPTTLRQNPAQYITVDIPLALGIGNDYAYNDETIEAQRTRNISGSEDVFYDIYDPGGPGDTRGNLEAAQTNADLAGYGQFSAGEAGTVVRKVPAPLENTVRFARLGVRLTAYYGLVRGTSPLVWGGAPQMLMRFVQSGF